MYFANYLKILDSVQNANNISGVVYSIVIVFFRTSLLKSKHKKKNTNPIFSRAWCHTKYFLHRITRIFMTIFIFRDTFYSDFQHIHKKRNEKEWKVCFFLKFWIFCLTHSRADLDSIMHCQHECTRCILNVFPTYRRTNMKRDFEDCGVTTANFE